MLYVYLLTRYFKFGQLWLNSCPDSIVFFNKCNWTTINSHLSLYLYDYGYFGYFTVFSNLIWLCDDCIIHNISLRVQFAYICAFCFCLLGLASVQKTNITAVKTRCLHKWDFLLLKLPEKGKWGKKKKKNQFSTHHKFVAAETDETFFSIQSKY